MCYVTIQPKAERCYAPRAVPTSQPNKHLMVRDDYPEVLGAEISAIGGKMDQRLLQLGSNPRDSNPIGSNLSAPKSQRFLRFADPRNRAISERRESNLSAGFLAIWLTQRGNR